MKPVVLLYNYQTLIAGFVALGGAALTVLAINKQIKSSQDQEDERRRRRNLAARAMMPAALSEICNYSERCMKILLPLLPAAGEHRVTGRIQSVPPVPTEALYTLRHSIEFGDDQVAEVIADLIRKIQIQHTRLVSTENRLSSAQSVLRSNVLDYIVDALEVFARASKLFPYARRATDEPATATVKEDLELAARNCGIWDESHEGGQIFARIAEIYRTEDGGKTAVQRG
jgi:hypothetical protein